MIIPRDGEQHFYLVRNEDRNQACKEKKGTERKRKEKKGTGRKRKEKKGKERKRKEKKGKERKRKEKKGKERNRKEQEGTGRNRKEKKGEGRKRKFSLSILLLVMDCIGLDQRQYKAKNTRDLRVAKQCSHLELPPPHLSHNCLSFFFKHHLPPLSKKTCLT